VVQVTFVLVEVGKRWYVLLVRTPGSRDQIGAFYRSTVRSFDCPSTVFILGAHYDGVEVGVLAEIQYPIHMSEVILKFFATRKTF
jgi:hypothetical protein